MKTSQLYGTPNVKSQLLILPFHFFLLAACGSHHDAALPPPSGSRRNVRSDPLLTSTRAAGTSCARGMAACARGLWNGACGGWGCGWRQGCNCSPTPTLPCRHRRRRATTLRLRARHVGHPRPTSVAQWTRQRRPQDPCRGVRGPAPCLQGPHHPGSAKKQMQQVHVRPLLCAPPPATSVVCTWSTYGGWGGVALACREAAGAHACGNPWPASAVANLSNT